MQGRTSVTIPLHKPKIQEKLFFLLSGVIVSIPLTSFIYAFPDLVLSLIPKAFAATLSVVFLAPFVEEFSKAYPLFYRHAETERSIFALGFLVGLGFGIVELIEYVVFQQVPILVRLPGVFFHASATSIVAFGIAKKRPIHFYLVAVVLHLSNNLLATFWPLYLFGGPAIIGLTYFLCWFFHQKTEDRMIPM